MKKSIIYVSLALVVFSNVAIASTGPSSKPITTTEYKNATPLAIAVAKGDIASVKKFIEYGSDINEKSNDMTPLMIAARYNQVAIINLLIENGATVKTKNDKGFSALKYAQLSNATQAADVLIQAAKA